LEAVVNESYPHLESIVHPPLEHPEEQPGSNIGIDLSDLDAIDESGEESLNAIGRRFDAEFPNDFHAAKRAMGELLTANDFDLFWELREKIVPCLVDRIISNIRNRRLKAVKRSVPVGRVVRGPAAIVRAEAAVKGFLASWSTMLNRKSLSECTGAELDILISKESKLAHGHSKNRAFYAMLRKRVSDKQQVKSAVTDDEARVIYDRIATKHRKAG